MPSITFDLETVTPLFLAGADQSTAELRPPAFRGALRYWFRAIAAGITTFNEVKKWENKVFGNTEGSGSVIIRIRSKQPISNCILRRDNSFPGLIYLFFSMYGDHKRQPRGCFPSGSHFKVTLQTRLNREQDRQCLELAIGAMWMLIHLGGIGSRSNRGSGNLKVRNQSQSLNLGLEFKVQSSDIHAMSSELFQGIRQVKEVYKAVIKPNQQPNIQPLTQFDIVHPQTSNLYLWQSENQENNEYWGTLLNDFGIKYQDFRFRYKNACQDDYYEIKQWLRTNGKSSINTVKRAAFGLPIQFRFSSLNNKSAFVEATGKINRSSSPLCIRVIELANSTVAVVLIHFKTQLIPNNRELLVKSKSIKKPISCAVPDQNIIDREFIPSLNLITVSLP